MDATRARQKIRERLKSGALPRDFDPTSFAVGHPPPNSKCAGCGEKFLPSNIECIGHRRSGKQNWFHKDCEKIWQEERRASAQVS